MGWASGSEVFFPVYEEILKVVKDAQSACFEAGAEELLINIKMQVRRDGDVSIEEKTGKYK